MKKAALVLLFLVALIALALNAPDGDGAQAYPGPYPAPGNPEEVYLVEWTCTTITVEDRGEFHPQSDTGYARVYHYDREEYYYVPLEFLEYGHGPFSTRFRGIFHTIDFGGALGAYYTINEVWIEGMDGEPQGFPISKNFKDDCLFFFQYMPVQIESG